MKNLLQFSILALLALFPSGRVWAMGEEDFGNTALNEANFQDWPGIMPLVNHPSRVYHSWVNGNEHFYYRGDAAALNDALRKFAASKAEVHEVLLRPAPCIVESFNSAKKIPYDWDLHIVGGIARYQTTLDLGSKVWSKTPTMTVCVGTGIDLGKIKVPKGVAIVDLADLSRRYREALASKDKTVRGWGTGQLAHLDPYDAENLAAISKLLKDEDDWVRLNAAGALAVFGKKAESVLPALRESLNTKDKQLKTRIEKTIDEIQQANDNTPTEKEHRAILKTIRDFRDVRNRLQ
jgi:HEAT repeats